MSTKSSERSTRRTRSATATGGQPTLRLVLVSALSMLLACACSTTRSPVDPPEPEPRQDPLPEIDASLKAPCPPLPVAIDGSLPGITRTLTDGVAPLYLDCRSKHGNLAAAVEEREAMERERAESGRIKSKQSPASAPVKRAWWKVWKR